jgi:hypothetical protein
MVHPYSPQKYLIFENGGKGDLLHFKFTISALQFAPESEITIKILK